MLRWLRWIGLGLLGLVLLVAMAWTASRLRGPTPDQREALARFQLPYAADGRNAYPLAWLLQWDVPDAEQEAITAEDAARFDALPAPGDPQRGAAVAAYRSVAAERHPDLSASLAAEPASCALRESGCLARVRADRDAHAARLAAAGRLVDRADAIAGYGHYRHLLPAAMDVPFPPLQYLSLPMTRHALQFVDGDAASALAGSCRALEGWRRLANATDSLVFAMYATAAVNGNADLLAEMLAELPPDHALPAECGAALAPLRDEEFDLCPAMQGEWLWVRSAEAWLQPDLSWSGRARMRLVYDRDATAALQAEYLGWPCREEIARMRIADARAEVPERRSGSMRFECWANPAGCILGEIAAPAYAAYVWRMQDAAARIRVLQSLAWMRERAAAGDGRDARALLGARPAHLQGGHRALELDGDGTALRMELFHPGPDPHWRIPLPQALHAPAEAR